MKEIIWTPNHKPTQSQINELNELGFTIIVYLDKLNGALANQLSNCPADADELYELTFDFIDTCIPVEDIVLPIGSPAFNAMLIKELIKRNRTYRLYYAHSERVSVDKIQEDGSVVKTSIFNHVCFTKVELQGE